MYKEKLRPILFGFLLIVALCFNPLAITRAGQTGRSQVDQAMAVLADYMTGHVDLAKQLLAGHNYAPPVGPEMWNQFPSIRKLETAYWAAENAEPNRGGDKLLALLSQDLARRYEAINERTRPGSLFEC